MLLEDAIELFQQYILVEKGLSKLSPEELENLGGVIEDLKDDGEINGNYSRLL